MSRIHTIPVAERAPAAPHCPGCGRAHKPRYNEENREDSDTPVVRVFAGWHTYRHFCTMRCATRYANWMFEKHGTRLTWKEES
jgi:hypothetical protein